MSLQKILKKTLTAFILIASLTMFLVSNFQILNAEVSTSCVDPVSGKIKNWVDCLTPCTWGNTTGYNPGENINTCVQSTDNQTLSDLKKTSFFLTWYDTYYQKQLLNATTLEARNAAFNKTVLRVIGDIGFILGSLYALTTIYQIIRATLDYVSAGNDEAKFKGAKKRVESLIWAFVYVVLAISIASILFSLMGFGNLFEIEILRNRPVDDTLIN